MDGVLIASAHQASASALDLLLRLRLQIDVVYTAQSWTELVACAGACRPSFILFDLELPGMPVAEGVTVLREMLPDAVLIALGDLYCAEEARLPVGVHACVSKFDPPAKLLAVLAQAGLPGDPTCPPGQSDTPPAGESEPPAR